MKNTPTAAWIYGGIPSLRSVQWPHAGRPNGTNWPAPSRRPALRLRVTPTGLPWLPSVRPRCSIRHSAGHQPREAPQLHHPTPRQPSGTRQSLPRGARCRVTLLDAARPLVEPLRRDRREPPTPQVVRPALRVGRPHMEGSHLFPDPAALVKGPPKRPAPLTGERRLGTHRDPTRSLARPPRPPPVPTGVWFRAGIALPGPTPSGWPPQTPLRPYSGKMMAPPWSRLSALVKRQRTGWLPGRPLRELEPQGLPSLVPLHHPIRARTQDPYPPPRVGRARVPLSRPGLP